MDRYPTPPPSAIYCLEDAEHFDAIAERSMAFYQPEIEDVYIPYPPRIQMVDLPKRPSKHTYQQHEVSPEWSKDLSYEKHVTQSRPESRSVSDSEALREHNSPRPRSPQYIHNVPKSYTPYSASKARPRKGLLRKALRTIKALLHKIKSLIHSHPIAVGLLSLLPLLLSTSLYKAITLSTSLYTLYEERRRGRVDEDSTDPDAPKTSAIWALGSFLLGASEFRSWWFDEFQGFGGTRGGAVQGGLRILQMLCNHWCRLSASGVPRTMAILLDVYFLEEKTRGEKGA